MTGRDRPVRRVLAHRDYRIVLAAMATSTAGDWLYNVALIVFVFDATGSATWVAAAGIARLLPFVLFGSFAGVLADRYDRRTVMLAADGSRAVVMAVLAVLTATGGSALLAVALAFVSTAAGTPFRPAQGALLPSLVPDDELAAANSVNSTVEHLALLVGPAVGGLLLVVAPPWVAFAVNAATFVVSGLLVAALRTRKPGDAAAEAPESFLAQYRGGLSALRGSPEITVLLTIAVAGTFQYGIESVVWVLVAEQRLGIGAEGVGFLIAALGAGGLLAAAATARLADHARPERVLLGMGLALGLPLVALTVIREPWLAYGVIAIEGAGGIVFDVVLLTLLQRLVRSELRGRVLGLLDAMVVSAIVVGMVVAPLIVDLAGLAVALVVGGLAVPVVTLAGLPVLRRAGEAAAARSAELAPRIARLRELPILDGAGPAAVEAVAAGLRDEVVPAGTAVVTEGEAADAVFLVVAGRFDVYSTGEAGGRSEPVAVLGPGDHFGEIGVLQGIPRTATVVAATDGSLLRMDGTAFADAVTRAPAMPRALREGMRERLARTHPSRAYDEDETR